MRRFVLLFFALSAVLAPRAVRAEVTRSIVLHANVVDFYSNRYILTADGNVSARFSDGTVVSGSTFTMDLKLNRFLIAGNVRIDGPQIHQAAAAFAGYPDIERSYVVTEGDVPDRYTYYGLDFANPHPGRQQPGDAFYFPNLTGEKPYIVSNGATIFLKNNVEFPVGSRVVEFGAYIPTPGWVVNYSANPNFYQNAFAGAIFDIGIPFTGSEYSLSQFHLRYDQVRGAYLSFDQHFVHDRDYAVFSVNPMTQNQRQWVAILYKRISPDVEARYFGDLFTLSQGLSEPKNASMISNFSLNARVGRYAVGLVADQFNNYLLGNPAPASIQEQHPFDLMLNVQSFENEWRVFRYVGVPVKFQYRFGYGYNYNSFGVATIGTGAGGVPPTFGGAVYPSIFQKYVGLTAYTDSMRIGKQLTISAKADKLEQFFSLPHHIVTTDVSATLARTPPSTRLPAFLLSYDVLNIGDYYGGQQLLAYPPATDVQCTPYAGCVSGLSAFRGFATARTLSASMIYTPTPYFALNVTGRYVNQDPHSVAGLGGSPPFQFNIDVRARISHNVLVDVSRQYYFNWANETWSPQYQVQFSP